jgi:hypothetical protein
VLALDGFPQLLLHQAGFDDPGQLAQAAVVGREIQPAAGVAVDLHVVHRRHAGRVEVLPDADGGTPRWRADRVDARVPAGRAGRGRASTMPTFRCCRAGRRRGRRRQARHLRRVHRISWLISCAGIVPDGAGEVTRNACRWAGSGAERRGGGAVVVRHRRPGGGWR